DAHPGDGHKFLNDPDNDICTATCCFDNGFDIHNAYIFFDYKNPDGSISRNPDGTPNVTLYLGWEIESGSPNGPPVIGDTDGDGNPDVRTIPRPGCTTNDGAGIASDEQYLMLVDPICVPEFAAVAGFGVQGNNVVIVDQATQVATTL